MIELFYNIITGILPLFLVLFTLYAVTYSVKNRVNKLKSFLFLFMVVVIMYSMIINMMLHTYLIATIWKDYELETGKIAGQMVETVASSAVTFIWSIIAIVIILFIWKHFCLQQVIPGKGSIKERLKRLIKNERGV